MVNSKKKKLLLLTGLILILISSSISYCYGKDNSAKDMVFISGNPKAYPVEYFDKKTGQYCGIIPAFFEYLSEKGEYQFIYICDINGDDLRKVHYDNGQADIISACIGSEKSDFPLWYDGIEMLKSSENDELNYKIVFTSIADARIKKYISEELSKVDSKSILSIVFDNAPQGNYQQLKDNVWDRIDYRMIIIAVTTMLLLIIAIIIYRRDDFAKAKGKRQDAITGVGNREYFIQAYKKKINSKNLSLYSLVSVQIDLENIKLKEEFLEENQILKYAADTIERLKEKSDYFARIDDNTFVIIKYAVNMPYLESWVIALKKEIERFPILMEKEYGVSVYAGAYDLKNSDRDWEEPLFLVNQACAFAKGTDTGYVLYTEKMVKKREEEKTLRRELMGAMKNGEIKPYIQPFVNSDNGKIVGGEVLCRWHHKERGMLSPAQFIPILENEGRISDLDYYMFEKTCAFVDRMYQSGIDDVIISTNMSRDTLAKSEVIEIVDGIIQKYDFPRHLISVEITENELFGDENLVLENFSKMRKELNLSVSIDDFGAGNTAFSDIIKMPVKYVKLDKELIERINSQRGRVVVKKLIEMCHELGIFTVCEGVEKEGQVDLLRQVDCDIIQGFLYYQPLPEKVALDIIKNER